MREGLDVNELPRYDLDVYEDESGTAFFRGLLWGSLFGGILWALLIWAVRACL